MKVEGTIKVNVYEVVARAVEAGAVCGVRRAYKYTATPTETELSDSVELEVLNALSDVLDFGQEGE